MKYCTMQSSAYIMINNMAYDPLVNFRKNKETKIQAQAKKRGSIENQIKSLKQDQPHLFYPRILS